MEEKTVLIWLDDIRDPRNSEFVSNWLKVNENKWSIYSVLWCKNYFDFKGILDKVFDIVDTICFDHDLASFDEDGNEYTGYSAASLVVDYCIEHNKKLPKYFSQSDNTPGRENILKLLDNFNNFQNTNV